MNARIAEILDLVKLSPSLENEPSEIRAYEEICGKWLDDEENEILYATNAGLLFRKITTPAKNQTLHQFWLLRDLTLTNECVALVAGHSKRVTQVSSLS